ncbi:MAG: sensor histidine kinase [Gemmatimonadaceae bacterium]
MAMNLSHSALGPPATWPPSLRTAVEIMMGLAHPASVTWCGTSVCNDACAALGDDALRDHFEATAIPLRDDGGASTGMLCVYEVRPLAPGVMLDEARATLARANEKLSANIAEREVAEEERRALQRQLAAAEEAERGRLSRELHDQLGQHLTAIALGLHEVASLVRAGSVARERLGALQELTSLLTRDARYLAIELRPPELDDVGLESAMASYVEQWSQRYGIAVERQSTGIVRFQYSGDVATAIYRILQEALTNVAKHARARQVSVIMEQTEGELRLIVEDDGTGFDVDTTLRRATTEHRLGLLGMRERASIVGGTVAVESSVGKGTTIFARVPVE